jgi:hypothetical protein
MSMNHLTDCAKARLYVNDAPQPVLRVNDLKHGDSEGAVGLWIGMGTEAYLADLRLLICSS